MKKLLLSTLFAIICSTFGSQTIDAATAAVVKMKTDAPEGTALRIQTMPYDLTVTGATKGKFFGEYYSQGPGTEITVTCEGLLSLEVYGCQLTELKVVTAPDLSIMRCYDNKINTLDLLACSNLEIFEAGNNNLADLDLSAFTKLEKVDVSKNKLTALNLGTQTALASLKCGNNPLVSLNLSGCPVLEELYFENCGLPTVNFGPTTKLWWVYAFGNKLKGDAMTSFINALPEPPATGMIYIVDTNNTNETNVCLMDDVRAFAKKGWATMDYLGGQSSDTQLGKFYAGADYVPVQSERTIKFSTTRQIGQTVKLYVKSSENILISGVAEQAVSGQTTTYTLTSQQVEIKGDLTAFECPGNDITSLTIGDDALLTLLDCSNNALTTLDLSTAPLLKTVYAQHNKLTKLFADGCNSLVRLDCYQNALKGFSMLSFMKTLCQSTAEPYLFVIDTKAADEANVATTDDVKTATDKGWKVFDYSNGDRFGMGVAYEGSAPTGDVLPDEYFTITFDGEDHAMVTIKYADANYEPIVEGGTVAGWNGSSLTLSLSEPTVKIYGDAKEIHLLFAAAKAIDVTRLPNLTTLNVALNDITSLDLSGNPMLESLSCEGNLLDRLDLTNNFELNYINCYGNQIKGDKMTAMINSLPLRSRSNSGTLIIRDMTYHAEGNVILKSDVLTALGKYWAVCELIEDDDDLHQYDGEDPAGIEDITVDSNAAAVYYDLHGRRIENPSAGNIYIVRQGNSSHKVIR